LGVLLLFDQSERRLVIRRGAPATQPFRRQEGQPKREIASR
jgi:hypothetical protein